MIQLNHHIYRRTGIRKAKEKNYIDIIFIEQNMVIVNIGMMSQHWNQ